MSCEFSLRSTKIDGNSMMMKDQVVRFSKDGFWSLVTSSFAKEGGASVDHLRDYMEGSVGTTTRPKCMKRIRKPDVFSASQNAVLVATNNLVLLT